MCLAQQPLLPRLHGRRAAAGASTLRPRATPHRPVQASYTSLLELMARAGQPQLAVQLCAEAHEAGALRCFALPGADAGPPQPGASLGNALDLR